MGNDRYNVIIVGAGPAGISAAYICAKNNLSVALFERGEEAGSKNMLGGVIYRKPTAKIIPAFWEKAPVERVVTEDMLWFMDQDSVVKVGFNGLNFANPPYNKFTVIRSKFDKWFARQAQKAGVKLITSTLVKDLIYEKTSLINRKVSGVILDNGDKIYADIVIIAEGGIGDLVQKAGLQGDLGASDYALYVKELLYLPKNTINERFNLEANEGVNVGIVGYPTSGTIGKGGIWTNKDTLSLTVGAYLNQMIERGLNPYQLLVRFKEHPLIKRLISGAETVEYLSHIIPKGDSEDMPELYDNGILVVGDSLMNIGGQGTVVAMLSGKFAAETAVQAAAKSDFSKKMLSTYKVKLKNSYIMENNLQQHNKKEYYQQFSDTDLLLAKTMNSVAYEFFTNTMHTAEEKREKILGNLKTLQPAGKSIVDFIFGLQNWRVL